MAFSFDDDERRLVFEHRRSDPPELIGQPRVMYLRATARLRVVGRVGEWFEHHVVQLASQVVDGPVVLLPSPRYQLTLWDEV
jgi:hypothetical protein